MGEWKIVYNIIQNSCRPQNIKLHIMQVSSIYLPYFIRFDIRISENFDFIYDLWKFCDIVATIKNFTLYLILSHIVISFSESLHKNYHQIGKYDRMPNNYGSAAVAGSSAITGIGGGVGKFKTGPTNATKGPIIHEKTSSLAITEHSNRLISVK